MREFTKSLFSLGLAVSFFSLAQTGKALRGSGAAKAFDSVTEKTTEEFGPVLDSTFRAADNVQRGVVSWLFGAVR